MSTRSPSNKKAEEIVLSRIVRTDEVESWREEDKEYAEKQLRKIYSEELSKVMKEKKFYIINHANKEKIDDRIERFYNEKMNKLSRMLERSLERKEKLLKDRVKGYEQSDKRWFHKKEEIKSKVKEEEKSMVEVARDYRLKSQVYWKDREIEEKNYLRDFSSKYHRLYNSNIKTLRSQNSVTVSSFNEGKLSELLMKRKNKLDEFRGHHSRKQQSFDHKQKERELKSLKENEKFQKMMQKINKIEKTQIKHDLVRKKESLERAKMKLNQKTYKNTKPEIGQDCDKHGKHYQHFRSRTLVNNNTPSPARDNHTKASISRSSSFYLYKEKKQQSLMRYYQKTRRLKITKLLKTNIRNVLNSQFRNTHSHKEMTIS